MPPLPKFFMNLIIFVIICIWHPKALETLFYEHPVKHGQQEVVIITTNIFYF